MDGDRALEQVGGYLCELTARRGQDRAALRRCPACRDSLADAEASERAHRVRKQRDPGADRINPWRTLEHDDLVPRPAQADRGAQPADAAPDDDHTHEAIIRGQVQAHAGGITMTAHEVHGPGRRGAVPATLGS